MPIAGISQGLGLGGGATATISGAPGGAAPLANIKSVAFDGVDDYATFTPGFIAATADFTFSFWLNVNAFPASSVTLPISEINGPNLRLYDDNDVKFESILRPAWGVKEIITGGSEDTWFHVVVVKQANVPVGSSTFTYYVDGSSVGTYVYGTVAYTYAFGNITGTPGIVYLGRYASSAGFFANVLIDEMAIFTSALDATAVSGIYNGGTPDDLSSLSPRNWYRMGDGTEAGFGATVYDMGASAGTTTDMTLVNAAYSTDVP